MTVKVGDVAKILDVSTHCIRKWSDAGKLKYRTNAVGTRYFDPDDLWADPEANTQAEQKKDDRNEVFYCRVSSRKQKDDLERQISKAEELYQGIEIIQDIASGLNWKRTGLRNLIKRITEGKISTVYVFHKDRLCRFGFEILEFIFSLHQVKLVVLDRENEKSREQEMSEDILEIMHVFSCSLYGKRKNSKFQTKDKLQITERFKKDVEFRDEDKSGRIEENDGSVSSGVQQSD